MAPLAPNNTPRFRFHYTVVGHQHSVQVRSSASPSAIGVIMGNYFNSFGLTCADIAIDFVDWAPTGSDIFNPVTTGIEGVIYTGGVATADQAAWCFTFLGRTPGGRRVRMTQFGALAFTVNYRLGPGESPDIDNVIDTLKGAGGSILGIDGLTPIWKDYADSGVNDHWVKVLRT